MEGENSIDSSILSAFSGIHAREPNTTCGPEGTIAVFVTFIILEISTKNCLVLIKLGLTFII